MNKSKINSDSAICKEINDGLQSLIGNEYTVSFEVAVSSFHLDFEIFKKNSQKKLYIEVKSTTQNDYFPSEFLSSLLRYKTEAKIDLLCLITSNEIMPNTRIVMENNQIILFEYSKYKSDFLMTLKNTIINILTE